MAAGARSHEGTGRRVRAPLAALLALALALPTTAALALDASTAGSRAALTGGGTTLFLGGQGTVVTIRGSLRNTRPIVRRTGAGSVLREIRVGRHRGFDRVVFEFSGGRPYYFIGYTGVARRDGSGQPIFVYGTTALEVVLGARSVDFEDPGFPRTFRPTRPLTPLFPTLRQVRYGNEFEGQTTFAVGLRARTGFRVLELRNPPRIAIDVAHGARIRTLKRGLRGADVRDWEERLNTVQFGFFAVSRRPAQGRLALDGIFGPRTARATLVFKRAEGLAANGVVGPRARAAMRDALRRASTINP